MHLYDWEAKRAGPTMTVNGKTKAGETYKITGVESIKPGAGGCLATTRDGATHTLIA